MVCEYCDENSHRLQACTINLPNMESFVCKATNSQPKLYTVKLKDHSNELELLLRSGKWNKLRD